MTRKDYELIADAINAALDISVTELARPYCAGRSYQRRQTAFKMADVLAADNSRFDRERFLKACGIDTDHHTG